MADTGSQNQLNAGLRYAGTAAGTLFGVLGALSLITPDQAHDLASQVQILNQSILTAYGALTKMGIILGPVAVVVAGYFGVKSSSVQAIGAKLLKIAMHENPPDPAAPASTGGLESVGAAAPQATIASAQTAIAKATSATEVIAAVASASPAVTAAKGAA